LWINGGWNSARERPQDRDTRFSSASRSVTTFIALVGAVKRPRYLSVGSMAQLKPTSDTDHVAAIDSGA
jgi:hypothetical protein